MSTLFLKELSTTVIILLHAHYHSKQKQNSSISKCRGCLTKDTFSIRTTFVIFGVQFKIVDHVYFLTPKDANQHIM